MSPPWMKRLPVIAAAFLATAALADAPRTPASQKIASARTAPLPRLVFFMNPSGTPCLMQDRILREMGAELAGKAGVVYSTSLFGGVILSRGMLFAGM